MSTKAIEAPSGKIGVNLLDLQGLAEAARRNGTHAAFFEVMLQWADAANAEIVRLREALAELEAQGGQAGEPVAAQCRFEGETRWDNCTVEHAQLVNAAPHGWPSYEVRLLYTHPQPSPSEVRDAALDQARVADQVTENYAEFKRLAASAHVVQWQKRHPEEQDGRWQNCGMDDAAFWKARPGWEVRALSLASQQAEPLLNGLTEAETAQTASVAGLVNREPSDARVEAAAMALLARRELKLEDLTDKVREHYLEDVRAVLRAADAVSAGPLPNPGSPEASAMIDSMLAEYGWPANPKNAARAGYEACRRIAAAPGSEQKEGANGYVLVPEKATPLIREALRIGMRREVPNDELCDIRWRAAIAAAQDSETEAGNG